jgi:hypothetical protein
MISWHAVRAHLAFEAFPSFSSRRNTAVLLMYSERNLSLTHHLLRAPAASRIKTRRPSTADTATVSLTRISHISLRIFLKRVRAYSLVKCRHHGGSSFYGCTSTVSFGAFGYANAFSCSLMIIPQIKIRRRPHSTLRYWHCRVRPTVSIRR